MAVKKSALYSSLWASCDSLRGGMDSSQYKDYILTLLFVKYVSDRYKGVDYGDIEIPKGGSFDDMLVLRGQKNIGEEMDKIIAKLAEANSLRGVIDNAHFNDPDKLGKGQEMVDKLSELLAIFRDKMPSFSRQHANGDDVIGDAYEYLMRNFATESGKSKGQFYTPAEVSRILAKVVGIEHAAGRNATLYDPACGSGSLLIRAAEATPANVAIYGQEKETTTAGLARMNLVLHNFATAVINGGYSTFSDPQYKHSFKDERGRDQADDSRLATFDFIVVNPPFSDKNWTHGLKPFGRFDGYGELPPQKNGDFAWLLHVLKSLKSTGKAAVILPHGVLFRGNAEATIRKSLVDRGLIKGIIGLPANLFYGTGIPACIIIIDKEDTGKRDGIFMIDASRDFVKDGNKNRLRERDVYKITTIFNKHIPIDGYSRFVPLDEIKTQNAYNLNLPRYISSGAGEDSQSIDGHLNGGIPSVDVESLSHYWQSFPQLKSALFAPLREDFYSLAVDKDTIRDTIAADPDFDGYSDKVEAAFEAWKALVDGKLRTISKQIKPKKLIVEIAELILKEYEAITLVDKYDAYEVLLSYWNETMSDDVYVIYEDGYVAAREEEVQWKITKKKDGTEKKTESGWDGKLIPKVLVIEMFFADEQKAINDTDVLIAAAQAELDEIIENADDGSAVNDVLADKGKLNKTSLKIKISEFRTHIMTNEITALIKALELPLPGKRDVAAFLRANPLCKDALTASGALTATSIKKRITEIRETAEVPEVDAEDYAALLALQEKQAIIDERGALVKELKAALDKKARERYPLLTDDEIMELLLERKWYASLVSGIFALYTAVSHRIAERVTELANRYEQTMPAIESDVAKLESKVKSHLERMGFKW